MTKTKLLNIGILTYLIIDVLHYFIIRMKPVYLDYSEAFYESNQTTFIKWCLCIIGFYLINKSRKTKLTLILIGVISTGMIWLSITTGALYHFLLWYSAISLWLLFFIGIFLLIFIFKNNHLSKTISN